jgi:hypothetical protein
MSDEFDQLLNDPRFPDRPTHPDFWALSEVILSLDGLIAETPDDKLEEAFTERYNSYLDLDSVTYMAEQRVARAVQHLGLEINENTLPLLSTMAALYVEATLVGRASGTKKESK